MTVSYKSPHTKESNHQPLDPYRNLASGIVLGAVKDVQRKNGRAADAARWLRTDDCASYCEAVGVNHDAVLRWLNHQTQPAQAGTNNTPLRTSREEQGTMTDQEPTTVDDFKSKMSQLDAQGQKEMDAAIDAALQRALANQQRRKPTAQYQTQLRAEYEKALSTAGSKTARVELRAMFRTRGLDI